MELFYPFDVRAQWPIGNDALQQVEDWPIYREGVLALQLSSTDPAGGDLDGTNYLYRQDSLYIIFDQDGPGCVYRFYTRNISAAAGRRVLIFFDHEVFPTINTTLGVLFSGLYQSFQSPLVGDYLVSSGGNYCYLPLPFAAHLKIALVDVVVPYQITYHIYPPATQVESFSGQVPSEVITQWQNTGSDPKSSTGNITASGSVILGPGQTQTIIDYTGAGSITGLHLTPSNTSLTVLESIKLRTFWDNSLIPQVECTLGSFFANTLGNAPVAGLPLGIEGNDFYCYYAMPFWQRARIELHSPLTMITTVTVNYTVTYKTTPYSSENGYFCTDQTSSVQYPSLGQDMIIGELSGHGNVAGMVVRLTTNQGLNFLHGDMRVYVDGQPAPIMQGTDFDADFNVGNYYVGQSGFSLPVHGAPVIQLGTEKNLSAYRFFLGDLIPFGSHVMLRSEHGNKNTVPLGYSSVVYSYRKPETSLVLSDQIDVADSASEEEHDYSIQGAALTESHLYAYPGTYDDQYFSDQGRRILGPWSFTISVDPDNRGIRLVRRRDASYYPQRAVVSMGDDSLGLWCDPDSNYFKRWGISTFEIPMQYTQDSSQLHVSFVSQGNEDWTEYYYWVYSHVPPRPDLTAPTQVTGLTLTAPESGSQMQLNWTASADSNGVARYYIYRSATPGVQPTSAFFVTETPMTHQTDQWLIPGTQYYYCVAAVDFSGNQGNASEQASLRTSGTYLLEGESFDVRSQSAGDTAIYMNMLAYGENWSNQAQLFFTSDAVGDSFDVDLGIAQTDTYDVAGYFTQGPIYGWVRLKIDHQAIGTDIDLYHPQIVRSELTPIATQHLTAGTHHLTFKVSGQNQASTGFRVGVDDLLLTSHLLTSIPPQSNSLPQQFALSQNYPNPFNAATKIQYSLPQAGWTSLVVFDVTGRLIESLQEGWQLAGQHGATWSPGNCSSGLYFLVLRHEDNTAVRKMLLIK